MRAYEVVYILDSSLDRASVESKIDALHGALGGEVTAVDHWGVRQLAYPIKKATTGCYVIAHVTVDPTALPEFERLLRLDEQVMRYLIVTNEGQPTSGVSLLAESGVTGDLDGTSVADEDEAPNDSPVGEQLEESLESEDGQPGDPTTPESRAEPEALAVAEVEADEVSTDAEAESGEGGPEAETEEADEEKDGLVHARDSHDTEPFRSPGAPPEFSGARGRRRRHEGPPIVLLNYKDVTTLSRFLTEQGKILPKRTTKVSARFQRKLGTAIKRARFVALLPYIKDHEG